MNGLALALTAGTGSQKPGPINTVAPVASNTGSGEIGDVLLCTTGTWSTQGTISGYTYQWQRSGVSIGGATTNSHVLVAGDDTKNLRCRVTATDEFGSIPAFSNALPIDFP